MDRRQVGIAQNHCWRLPACLPQATRDLVWQREGSGSISQPGGCRGRTSSQKQNLNQRFSTSDKNTSERVGAGSMLGKGRRQTFVNHISQHWFGATALRQVVSFQALAALPVLPGVMATGCSSSPLNTHRSWGMNTQGKESKSQRPQAGHQHHALLWSSPASKDVHPLKCSKNLNPPKAPVTSWVAFPGHVTHSSSSCPLILIFLLQLPYLASHRDTGCRDTAEPWTYAGLCSDSLPWRTASLPPGLAQVTSSPGDLITLSKVAPLLLFPFPSIPLSITAWCYAMCISLLICLLPA